MGGDYKILSDTIKARQEGSVPERADDEETT